MTADAWRRTLGFGALCLLAPVADALTLGKLEVRSPRGAPLEARIPVHARPGEAMQGACFGLLTPAKGGALAGASLELRRHARGAELQLRTREALREPGGTFAIAVGCPGASAPTRVAFSLDVPVVSRAPVALVTRFTARDGDSLGSLARAIYPNDEPVRSRYLTALRDANPPLATLADDAPLPQGTPVALPDLHAFARSIPARRTAPPAPPRAATRLAAADARPIDPLPSSAAQPSAVHASRAQKGAEKPRADAKPEAAPAPRAAAGASDGFKLRLSAPVLDLSPSRHMDERSRAELRERLLVLEADDRTAAMLAMRENIRRLESQVNALRLKLAAMPAPTPKAASAASGPEAPARKVEAPAPKVEAPAPKVEAPAPRIETTEPKAQAPAAEIEAPASQAEPPASKVESTVPKLEAPAPQAETPAPKAEAPALDSGDRAAQRKAAPSRPIVRSPSEPWYANRSWLAAIGGAMLLALALLLALRLSRRRASEAYDDAGDIALDATVMHDDAPAGEDATYPTEPPAVETQPGPEPERERMPATPREPTRIPDEDRAELRRRYMAERFPEVENGALVLDDPRSVVNAARLLYDDGAIDRAIELLHFHIEQDPGETAPWLALFDIFRRERLSGEYAQLAERFRESHGDSDAWPKVRSVGRTIDPDHPLYEGAEFGAADPEAEGWLRPARGENRRALAGELRAKLMAGAQVTEDDLRSDPTPALRKAESFTVA